MSKKNFRIICVILALILAVTICYLFFLNRSVILKYYGDLENFITSTGIVGAAVFVLIIITKTLLPVFPSEPFEILSGAVYGGLLGGLLCHLGVLIGGILVYILGKRLNRLLSSKVNQGGLFEKMERLKNQEGFEKICFLLFFLPGTPKEILMIIVCTLGIDFKKYLFYITVLRIPAVFSSTLTGTFAGQGRFTIALIIYGATAIFGVIGYYYKNKVTK